MALVFNKHFPSRDICVSLTTLWFSTWYRCRFISSIALVFWQTVNSWFKISVTWMPRFHFKVQLWAQYRCSLKSREGPYWHRWVKKETFYFYSSLYNPEHEFAIWILHCAVSTTASTPAVTDGIPIPRSVLSPHTTLHTFVCKCSKTHNRLTLSVPNVKKCFFLPFQMGDRLSFKKGIGQLHNFDDLCQKNFVVS